MFTSQNMRVIWRRCFWSALVLIIICFNGSGVIAGQAETFFSDAPVSAELYALDKRTTHDPAVIRSRYVLINLNVLLQKSETPPLATNPNQNAPGQKIPITLNLFPSVSYTAINDRIELRGAGRFSWFGHIDGVELSQVTLVVNNGLITGNVHGRSGELYQIRPLKKGMPTHVIYEIDQNALPK
jgi:hypothetical protein